MRRGLAAALAALAGLAIVASSGAASERKLKRPRIVAAVMADVDRDARADGVRLTYSQRVRHRADRDGKYPFAVSGYRIRSVGAASGRTLVVLLVEKAQPDPTAAPAIRYRRTRSRPVVGLTKVEAAAQLFRATRPHGFTPPEVPPPPAPPTVLDADGDGTVDSQDCAPQNKDVHPGAADLPDLAFLDANCDGIDGTERNAIFASPKGSDGNPGTKQRPKRQIQAAVQAAAGKNRYVLAAAGEYTRVVAASGVAVYGGYNADRWSRNATDRTEITGTPEGVFADGAKNVTLQLLRIYGVLTNASAANGASVYGIRAINNSSLRLQQVAVFALDAAPGPAGVDGAAGQPGSPGLPGAKGAVDSDVRAPGGLGGESPAGRNGGNGGAGRYESDGRDGEPGLIGTPGGKGGDAGDPGLDGRFGQNGTSGARGASGGGGSNSTALATAEWIGQGGTAGLSGTPGNGGGGGGGGGGQTGIIVINGTGCGGGGGGGGGEGGGGGAGGGAGGGSFGIYLHNSSLVVESSTIRAGMGGAGGRGGSGGPGGDGGAPGTFGYTDSFEVGDGGRGGFGGAGGQGGGGGGGAGGPSIAIFKAGTSTARVENTTLQAGTPGPGGATGAGGSIFANPFPAQAGIAQAIYP